MNDEPSSELNYLRKRLDELEKQHQDFALQTGKDIGRLQGWKERVDTDLSELTRRVDRLIELLLQGNHPARQGSPSPLADEGLPAAVPRDRADS